jgi:hypothetical protein
MKPLHKYLSIASLAAILAAGGAYMAFSPSVWERDALGSIKAGDYDEAIKVCKRGLVEKPGSHKLQAIFLAATALNRSKDGETAWEHETVSVGASRFLADLNIVGHLGADKPLWVDGETRQKAVDVAQDELREIRKGFASKGMVLEDVKDLRDIGRTAANAFLALKLDPDKHEVQRANLAAHKTLMLLGDDRGTKGVIKACEAAKDLDRWERIRALVSVAEKDFPALKTIAFDKDHSLFKEARIALTLAIWDSEDGNAALKNFDQVKLVRPTGNNWEDLAALSDVEAAKRKRRIFVSNQWNTENKDLIGASFAWSVPLIRKDSQAGVGVVGRLETDGMKILPIARFIKTERDSSPTLCQETVTTGDPVRLAIRVATRQEMGTAYRNESKYSRWKGFYQERVPYKTMTGVDYWAVLAYNAATKRMDFQHYVKGPEGQTLFATDAAKLDGVPSL